MFKRLRKGHTNGGRSPIKSVAGARAGRPGQRWWNSKWSAFLAAGLITFATVAAFSNSFGGVFVFDDEAAILNNITLQRLWPLSTPLSPPNNGSPVDGRPLLNLSLGINYAISQYETWSYHTANLAIHLTAAILLLGILWRTFDLPSMRDQWAANRVPLALGIALMWAIHPLQTESVTYISQRAESLVGVFYFLTLYCFVRGESSACAGHWHVGAVLACLLGMASKEVMASAPLAVLLFDRAFCAGSFREAWRRHNVLYLSLAATWVLLGWLVVSGGGRADTIGFGLGISMSSYLQTQFWAIAHYLQLCIWPDPLLLDYGTVTMTRPEEIVPAAVLVVLLGIAMVVALWRSPKIGFLGACFFMILAPTSSVIPVATQTIAEHRMYLPLAAVLATAGTLPSVAGRWLAGRGTTSWMISPAIFRRALPVMGGCLAIAVGLGFGILTFLRNQDYQSAVSIWQDTVAKAPGNVRAHHNLGLALMKNRQQGEAIAEYQKALKLDPEYVHARMNLAGALGKCGRIDESVYHFQQALRIRPGSSELHCCLGGVLVDSGRIHEGIDHLRKALEIQPDSAEARNNLGTALAVQGRLKPAIAEFRKALEINPGLASGHNNLGLALVKAGRINEAAQHFQKAVELQPEFALAHYNLGSAWRVSGRRDEAAACYRQAIALSPENAEFHQNLAIVLSQQGLVDEAIVEYRKTVKIKPDHVEAQNNLGYAYYSQGRLDEAIRCYRKALRIQPRHARASNNLGAALGQQGRFDEAIVYFQAALAIQPDNTLARDNLASALRQVEGARVR